MINDLKFVIRYIRTSGNNPFYDSTDISNIVKSYSLDSFKFADSDTLMIEGRTCSLEIININNIISDFKSSLLLLNETTELIYTNSDGETSQDTGINEDQNRLVKFIRPFIDTDDVIFPVTISGDSTGYIPARRYDEEPYADFDDEYVVERPLYYNLIIDVYRGEENETNHIYRGILKSDSYKYNYKTRMTSLLFIDGLGVLISLIDKLKNYNSFYQGEDSGNSGTTLDKMPLIISSIIRSMYSSLDKVFNIDISYIYNNGNIGCDSSIGIELGYHYKPYISVRVNSLYYPNTIVKTIEFDSQMFWYSFDYSGTEYYLFGYLVYINPFPVNPDTTAFEIYVEVLYKSWGGALIGVVAKTYQFAVYISSNVFFDGGDITYQHFNTFIEFTAHKIAVSHSPYICIDYNSRIYYDGYDLALPLTEFDEYNYYINTPYYNFMRNVSNISNQFTFGNFVLLSSLGFNSDVTLTDVSKIFLLSLGASLITFGKNISMIRYKVSNTSTCYIDDYLILSMDSSEEIYEPIDLSVLENVSQYNKFYVINKIKKSIGFLDDATIKVTKYQIEMINRDNLQFGLGQQIEILKSDGNIPLNVSEFCYLDKNKVNVIGYAVIK